ncbi:hypothetical protein GCM10010981_09470 [Dyella nitratireducens]|uniref:Uncharacterized protein n=2 Tax=Dyella nitratireducens TaxID=1849580 RepID=A0ABQ1FP48_9GAMM|nr:hypothetical protein GCM10010981_09470 [Dyella nitratireducens]GLQ43991.1 hypothetical protein GCM10007902_38410 [Dyella nitratireducens]
MQETAQGGPNVPQAAQNALAALKDFRQWAMSNIYQSPSEPAPQGSGQGGGSQAPSIDSKSFVQRAQQSAQDHPGLRPLINSMFQDARYSPGISNSGTGTNTSNSSST